MTRPAILPRKQRPQLPLAAYRWLLQGQRSSWFYLNIHAEDEQRAFWNANRDAVVAWYIKRRPGFRPLLWWRFDAPEPRRQLGGIGTPLHECSAVARHLEYGVPAEWRTERDDGYLREGVPISDDDPPLFESEANYLRRHGLLLPGERQRLHRRSYEACVLVLRDRQYQLLRQDRFRHHRQIEFQRIGPLRALLNVGTE
jgi:hypothetical protein